ncbi:hypothetical protein UT300012_22170 [Paraclostridium bifermentans]
MNKGGVVNKMMYKLGMGKEEVETEMASEFDGMEAIEEVDFISNNYQLPEKLNERLLERAEEMNLDSCELMKLIIDMALNRPGDIRIDYIEAEKERMLKYFRDREEITLNGTVVFYDNLDIATDIDVEQDRFDLIITFKQGTNKVARKVVSPIEDYLA